MSTIVVVRKEGSAVIGADTLTKYGGLKEGADYIRNHSKILRVGENYFALAGHASFHEVFASYFRRQGEAPRLDSVDAVFEFTRRLHPSLKDDYYLNPKEEEDDEFESSRMECLIANPWGIFGFYTQRSVQEYARFYAFGSGYAFAMGAMHALYDTGATAEEIARAGLVAAAEFDDATGAPLEVFSVALRPE